jgi:hypothetical protein
VPRSSSRFRSPPSAPLVFSADLGYTKPHGPSVAYDPMSCRSHGHQPEVSGLSWVRTIGATAFQLVTFCGTSRQSGQDRRFESRHPVSLSRRSTLSVAIHTRQSGNVAEPWHGRCHGQSDLRQYHGTRSTGRERLS